MDRKAASPPNHPLTNHPLVRTWNTKQLYPDTRRGKQDQYQDLNSLFNELATCYSIIAQQLINLS
eukprot:13989728-Heterocapsa_arctica.AAC.1